MTLRPIKKCGRCAVRAETVCADFCLKKITGFDGDDLRRP